MVNFLCPYCLSPYGPLDAPNCEQCTAEVPPEYRREVLTVPTLSMMTVGFSNHGKTNYLLSLLLTMDKAAHVLPAGSGYHGYAMGGPSLEAVRRMRQGARAGAVAEPTQKGTVEPPILYKFAKFPGSATTNFAFYDIAGEYFGALQRLEGPIHEILRQCRTIWFLVSLTDLEESAEGNTLPDLFQIYLGGVQNLGVDLANRDLVVVFTKGDRAFDLPEEVEDYLATDPFRQVTRTDVHHERMVDFDFSAYVRDMQRISDRLRRFTAEHQMLDGASFISMVEARGLRLHFCVTSALGQDPHAIVLDEHDPQVDPDLDRQRVLDPALWAIHLDRGRVRKKVAIVLDSARGSEEVLYGGDDLQRCFDQVAEYADFDAYTLGRTRVTRRMDQPPPTAPEPHEPPRLVGPILDSLPESTTALVLATEEPDDLGDFVGTQWADRLFLAVHGDEKEVSWLNSRVYPDGIDVQDLVNYIQRIDD